MLNLKIVRVGVNWEYCRWHPIGAKRTVGAIREGSYRHDNRQTGNRRGQVKIERVHRTKSKSNKNKDNQMKPRTMVVKLHSYKDKIKFLRNASKLKDTNIFRNKNFSVETLNYWKELWIKTQKCVKKVNIIPSVPRNFC